MDLDHYSVLGLSSVEFDCTKLTQAEIKTAYQKKALELHPDTIMRKRKGNSDCSSNNVQANDDIAARTAAFQQLQSSYALLMDKRAREIYDLFWLQSRGEGNLRTESNGVFRSKLVNVREWKQARRAE
ncbi:uncharacterized protein LOC110683871 [Chenopodium quinoa]|uniref:uncharacterized protein LOC110683871 n=1 Tax=Chenopodium quinoa TaxID=63459 RepID=UPI000B77BE70|nr:uncharacterized protein LOC110683871 [Chenopodium quinoa]